MEEKDRLKCLLTETWILVAWRYVSLIKVRSEWVKIFLTRITKPACAVKSG